MSTVHRVYSRPPFAPAYMLNAFRRSPGWRSERGCPDMRLEWRGFRIEPQAIEGLRAICGLDEPVSSRRMGLLYPQVTGFRLIMALLTHPAWPLPIWNALQIRNRLVLHRPLQPGEEYGLDVQPTGWRVLAKGVEIDLHTRLTAAGDALWESIVTFYYRGRYGAEMSSGDALGADPEAPRIAGVSDATRDHASATVDQWNVGDGNRWQFGRLTGDYNGLHQWDAYARRMGFPAAFPHPQRVLGQCLAHLPEQGEQPVRLDLWIKGPVFFGRDAVMTQQTGPGPAAREFGLWLAGEARPALIGAMATSSAESGRIAA